MTTTVNPADLKPGQFAPMPETSKELVIEALRLINRTSVALNDLSALIGKKIIDDDDHRFDMENDILIRRFSDLSGVHLFIAADNLRIDLPADLRGDDPEEDKNA